MVRKIVGGAIAILYVATAGAVPQYGWYFGVGAAEAQPADRGSRGRSDSAPGRSGDAPGNSGNAPGRSGDAPGNSGNAPGRSGEAPGNSGSAPGRSGEAPGNSGSAPGRSGEAPGNSGNAPGRSGEAPGNSGNAPGRSGEAPGNSGNAPGRSGDAPGNSGNAPGRSGEASGNSGNAPGRSGEAPGNSGNAPGRSGDAPGNSGNAPGRSGEARGNTGNAPARAETAAPNRAPSAGARPPEPVQAAAAPRIRPAFRGSGNDDSSSRQNEISVVGLDAAARSALTAAGFSTISSRRSSVLGNRDVSRMRVPANLSPQEAAAAVRQSFAGVVADLTHLYRPAAQPVSVRYAHELVGVEPAARCPVNLRVGLIDTGTNRHDALRRARLVQRNFVERSAGGNTLHGTAVASLLVGDLPGLEPLVPGGRLYSANVFAGHEGVLAADVTAIIEALDWMAANRTRVVNLSLAGPANELLEQAVLGAARKGLILVAAGGNDGPSAPPAYPAAYPAVIAVAAVDERGRAYSGNNRGSYVEISAPGVDIWAADARGGEAFWTGTSFAVPFVTAALAREVAAGTVRHIDDARRFLGASARDLGPRGRDPIYGHGLLRARSCQ